MAKLQIDVWSDIACPWCYVGKRRLEAALEGFPHRDEVAITWHSFELDPSASQEIDVEDVSYAQRLAEKYRVPVAGGQQMIDNMTATAAKDGIAMRFDVIRPGNTFDAHRLLHLAEERGKQDALKERLLAAYLCEGERIGDHETLVRLAGEVGLDVDEAEGVLASQSYAADVRSDESQAAQLGIHGVPFFVFDRKYAVQGAQPAEIVRKVLDKAWEEAEPQLVTLAEGAVCGPEGCD